MTRQNCDFFKSLPVPESQVVGEEGLPLVHLWRAVLDQATEDLINGPLTRSDQARQTYVERWMKTDDFVIVCDMAYLEETFVRNKITAFIEAAVKGFMFEDGRWQGNNGH